MKLIICPRQNGKTTKAVAWLREGTPRPEFPGWTRVLLVPDLNTKAWMVKRYDLSDGQIFSFYEWRVRTTLTPTHTPPTEVMLDNAELILGGILGRNTTLAGMTINQDDDDA